MNDLPKDPIILLSYVNTQLRDFYSSLDDFCLASGTDKDALCRILSSVDYIYDEKSNRFI